MLRDQPARSGRWRLHLAAGDLGRAVLALLGAGVGLQVASWVLPGFDVGGWLGSLVAAISIAVWGVILRPILVQLSVLTGWVGAALVGFFGQALIIWVAVFQPSDLGNDSIVDALLASWIVAGVSTLFGYLATAGTDDAVAAALLRKARRRPATVPDPDVPGILFVQADGVPFPVLDFAVRAGNLPTLSRWIRSGSHTMAEWRPRLPATTPASQMGILHGTIEGIPAFRWIDRGQAKVYVANKPADAALIEARHSDGRGLLVDDGVSVSNLFTGDAVTAYATMSAVNRTQETRETRLALSQFLASPAGLARAVPKVVSEVVRERFQRSRAERRDIRPRVHRGWGFAGERAALIGVLRDLNTALVADALLKGRRSIYVDYVDYDAVAHHVGVVRPEALDALAGIDAVLGQLEKIAAAAPRKYHIVVLSDHGQSQGEIFADRYGEDLSTLVSRLADSDVVSAEKNHEGSGSLHMVIASSGSDDTVLGRAIAKTSDRMATQRFDETSRADDVERAQRMGVEGARRTDGKRVARVSAEDEQRTGAEGERRTGAKGEQRAGVEGAEGTAAEGAAEQFIVFGSGNLGLVYVAGETERLTAQQLSSRFPSLLPGLVSHPGIGFVVVMTDAHGPVVLGERGEHRVRDRVVIGEDPLAPFGPDAAEFVLRAAMMPEAPDIYVNSLLDEIGEVAAFEGLVGCHGGLGGWQDRAMLVWPAELPAPVGMVVGADGLHQVLVGWLEHLGHRGDLRAVPLP